MILLKDIDIVISLANLQKIIGICVRRIKNMKG